MDAVKWMVKGQVVIACNCDYGCPCNVNGRPTTGQCEGGWTWAIEKGAYGDVPLDGLTIGQYAKWPAAIHEGNGVAVSFIDERADKLQRQAFETLLDGKVGGPWAIFRGTYRELHGPRFVRYAVDAETNLPTVVAEGAVEVEMTYIVNPVTGDTIHPRLVLPEGLIVKEAALTATKRFKVKDDHVKYDHSGRYGAAGFFQYFGPQIDGTEVMGAVTDRKRFRGKVRYFRPEKASGLAVVDIPASVTASLGGLKQMKVRGSLNGVEFTSNTMPAGGGVLALSVSRKLLDSAQLEVGDSATIEIERL